MQFHHGGVSAYFRLDLRHARAAVALDYLRAGASIRPSEETQALIDALTAAALPAGLSKAEASRAGYH
jgi:hypothetical protein